MQLTRNIKAMHPDWNEKKIMYGDNVRNGNSPDGLSDISENKIMRLVFHDCAKYTGRLSTRKGLKKIICYYMQMELVVVMVVLTGRGWMQRFQMSSKNQNFTVMNQ